MKLLRNETPKPSGIKRALSRPRILIAESDVFWTRFWRLVFSKIYPRAQLIWAKSKEEVDREIQDHSTAGENIDLVIADAAILDHKSDVAFWKRISGGPTEFILTSSSKPSRFNRMVTFNELVSVYIQKPFSFNFCAEAVQLTLRNIGY